MQVIRPDGQMEPMLRKGGHGDDDHVRPGAEILHLGNSHVRQIVRDFLRRGQNGLLRGHVGRRQREHHEYEECADRHGLGRTIHECLQERL